ncbi:protein of unknown function (DUF2164 family) [Sporomusaceae bacterium BoRhaA]|uniref:DUF2164 domain-containing protein n=1 Tax=Pelorhabdus rhamnosifermentans TaxID=2772457 RepID=UPI001C05F6C9|nr:DUF2164 domain-containing protein [Pelorhabdus rhamnosifermentans]MBU2700540.1 protein of unknown function (DUF2164 family) [Pelorhabdus rhamnosifermentans]
MQSKGIQLSKENQEVLLASIQKFFLTERDEELSEFQAALFLDFILQEAGVYIYNQAIADAHQLMNQKTEELFSLEKRIIPR